jgi:hypothetical protein
MKNSFLPPAATVSSGSPRGGVAVLLRRRRVFLAFTLVFSLLLLGCGTGTITTSTGQVVPAGTVMAQDTAADVLKSLDDAYKAASAAHDAIAATEDPVVHAKHRTTLLATLSGLRSSWDALIAWKGASTGAAPPDILKSVVGSAPDFVALALQLKAIDQKTADSILKYLNTFFPGGTP